MRSSRRSLAALFAPRSVAVIGASERPGSVGRTVFTNLRSSKFIGDVYPINIKHDTVLGVPAYPSLSALSEPVDLAVVVTPAATVPGVMEQCAAQNVPAVIIISAGFKELGQAGIELENRILEIARASGIRVLGPNCLGLMNPLVGLNATFAGAMAKPGNVAFLSQSGALCTAILDWSLQQNVGFSAFVSTGSMLDISWGDLIDYFGREPRTSSILLYVESVGDARSFLSAAREVALTKPIIAIKAGRTEAASKAAASHTGSLAGSDLVFDAALQRVGVLRVDRIAELFSMATVLAKQPRPKGPRLTIVTNAGGPGVLATDALVQGGGKLAELSGETIQALDALLPAHWSRANPIDVLGDAEPQRYAQTLQLAAKDPASDGLLVILTPQDMTDPKATAEQLLPLARVKDKPVLASWMGGPSVQPGIEILNQASIPNFPYPDTAARAFNCLWRHGANLRNLYETPALVSDDVEEAPGRISAATAILARARITGRTLLSEDESKRLLAAYGVPTVPTEIAVTEDEAVATAERIGFPVVLKLFSRTITHKTDVGGVQLNIRDTEQVAQAFRAIQQSVSELAGTQHFQGVSVQPMVRLDGYEIILGSTLDAQFGPVVMFGTGGQMVEVLRDRAFGLPPLNATFARRMMEQTRIYTALKGIRGRAPVDMTAMERVLIAFSKLLVEQPLIKECDVNPLLVSPEKIIALDARVVLHDAGTRPESLPRPAIRPYPIEYVCNVRLKDGTSLRIRPIRLEDEPLMVEFHQSLSEESVRARYFQLMNMHYRTDHNRLIRVCYNDYDRELVLVADKQDELTGRHSILGVARLSREWREPTAEFAVIISDAWHGRGLGTQLLNHLIDVGRREGIRRFVGYILPENSGMQKLCRRLNFQLGHDFVERVVRAELEVA